MADSDNESGGHNNSNAAGGGELSSPREQDRFLPIANVSRIMKKALPANAKISKDAKETVQECVSEFISFITGEASDKCQREKRKTINGDDLLWAMTTLGFEEYVDPLKVYLQRFRELEGEKGGAVGAAASSSSSQSQQKDGAAGGNGGGAFVAGGGGGGGGAAGLYAAGGMPLVGQHVYGAAPSPASYHHHQVSMGGGGRGGLQTGGNSSPAGLGRPR